jgi:flagellar L-ring protein precursor FlgH
MKRYFAALAAASFFVMQLNAAPIYNLYNAHRAMRTDDILTVVIVESAKAGSQSGTSTQKQNDLSLQGNGGTGVLKFLPSFGASGSSKVDYDGKGGTTREGNLVAKISARVVKVLDNGNLVIDGSKLVEINEEKEIIKVDGVVRPQDIEGNNIIYSYNIADAHITYSGKGTANTGQRPGILARILNWIF